MSVLTWPAQADLAVALAEAAGEPRDWPGLGRVDLGAIRLLVVPDQATFRRATGGFLPGWGAGATLPGQHTIVIRADAGDPAGTLRHELAHLALHTVVSGRVPLWFDEGYAAFASGEWDRLDAVALNLAVVRGAIPELDELNGTLRGGAETAAASYALAMSAVTELARLNPSHTLGPLLARLRGGVPFDTAVRETTGLSPGQFAARWRADVRLRYGWLTWFAAGGIWVVAAVLVLALARVRRRMDRPRRTALDQGWVIPGPDDAAEALDRGRSDP